MLSINIHRNLQFAAFSAFLNVFYYMKTSCELQFYM